MHIKPIILSGFLASAVFVGATGVVLAQTSSQSSAQAQSSYPGLFPAQKQDGQTASDPENIGASKGGGYTGVVPALKEQRQNTGRQDDVESVEQSDTNKSGVVRATPSPGVQAYEQAQEMKNPGPQTAEQGRQDRHQKERSNQGRSQKQQSVARDVREAQSSQTPRLAGIDDLPPLEALKVKSVATVGLANLKKAFSQIKLPDRVLQTLSRLPSASEEGKPSPTERKTQMMIDKMMAHVTQAEQKDRRSVAKEVKENLENMRDNFYYKKSIPAQSYKDMGLPDHYIEHQSKGIDASIDMVDQAILDVKKYL